MNYYYTCYMQFTGITSLNDLSNLEPYIKILITSNTVPQVHMANPSPLLCSNVWIKICDSLRNTYIISTYFKTRKYKHGDILHNRTLRIYISTDQFLQTHNFNILNLSYAIYNIKIFTDRMSNDAPSPDLNSWRRPPPETLPLSHSPMNMHLVRIFSMDRKIHKYKYKDVYFAYALIYRTN